ncbi:DUF4227 family protein [Effusibacillus lacus]|uniref:DUF4227 domain-containing protein n=1 Tax=Effusibacillus lacus TaxID=1348429 RepID=A0A292YL83_9BACL|nr:DUF4227 family protein [Effusibacillus lacus]TCS76323.1 uncharacterized protein DUF4227 [Effusibacillus lacus]GAX91867.1 hypothetical protein EFBL_3558 [Effusibacillus lacus]
MIISLRRITRWIHIVILVGLFSFVLFKMMEVVHVWMQPVNKYREPRGDSLKVNSDLNLEQRPGYLVDGIIQRLKVFYMTGE